MMGRKILYGFIWFFFLLIITAPLCGTIAGLVSADLLHNPLLWPSKGLTNLHTKEFIRYLTYGTFCFALLCALLGLLPGSQGEAKTHHA